MNYTIGRINAGVRTSHDISAKKCSDQSSNRLHAMGILKDTHAWAVTISVLLVSVAVGMMAFAIITPPNKITTYFIAQSVCIIAAVALNGWNIYSFEKDKLALHKAAATVKPKGCPDYWTGRYDGCSKSMVCDPYHETTDPAAPRVYMNSTRLAPIDVNQHAARGPEQLCSDDNIRVFPWMEITNSCDARGRAV